MRLHLVLEADMKSLQEAIQKENIYDEVTLDFSLDAAVAVAEGGMESPDRVFILDGVPVSGLQSDGSIQTDKSALVSITKLRRTWPNAKFVILLALERKFPEHSWYLNSLATLGIYNLYFSEEFTVQEVLKWLDTEKTWQEIANLINLEPNTGVARQTTVIKQPVLHERIVEVVTKPGESQVIRHAAVTPQVQTISRGVAGLVGAKGGMGVSTLAYNMAVISAQQKLKTCLIELDYTCPSLGIRFGIDHPKNNILACLKGEIDYRDALVWPRLWQADNERPWAQDTLKVQPENLAFMVLPELATKQYATRIQEIPKTAYTELINTLLIQEGFESIIVDLPPVSECEFLLNALRAVAKTWFVFDEDYSTVQQIGRLKRYLELRNINFNHLKYGVLNRCTEAKEFQIKDVGSAYGLERIAKVHHEIDCQARNLARETLKGTPVWVDLLNLTESVLGLKIARTEMNKTGWVGNVLGKFMDRN